MDVAQAFQGGDEFGEGIGAQGTDLGFGCAHAEALLIVAHDAVYAGALF